MLENTDVNEVLNYLVGLGSKLKQLEHDNEIPQVCRLILDIKMIRAQRVQDITAEDARAEGAVHWYCGLPDDQQRDVFCNASVQLDAEREMPSPRDCFIMLWDSINKVRYPWASNPYVWVIEFNPVVQ